MPELGNYWMVGMLYNVLLSFKDASTETVKTKRFWNLRIEIDSLKLRYLKLGVSNEFLHMKQLKKHCICSVHVRT